MTREDVLKELCVAQADIWYRPSDDAIDMAIEAVELVTSYENTINKLTETIANTQEPKTGHWGRKTKVDAYDIAGVKSWGIKCQCDRCGFITIVIEDFGYYKYCPNCGAKMEGEALYE